MMNRSIILFPGQGSQYVGMAQNLCKKARSLFDMANQVLGYDLLRLCQRGPEEDLDRTIHSQPAVFVSNLAAAENLNDKSNGAIENCVATAGFSLGEYSSLVLAQSIDFVDALRLVKLRAEVTQGLCETVPSAMMTVVFGNNANIKQACSMAREYCVRSGINKEESECSIANYLFPHGKVIGGHQKALEFIEQNGKDFGIRKMKRLAVSGAFHTNLMKPAAAELKKALAKTVIKEPKIPVYSNVDAKIHKDPESIRKSLILHVYKPVLWEQLLQKLYDDTKIKNDDGQIHLPVTFECGPQKNMTTILGMVNLKAKQSSFNIEP